MKTELKVFNDLIDIVVKHSCNNEANITDVNLWAKSWRREMTQALSIAAVVKQSELLIAFAEWKEYNGKWETHEQQVKNFLKEYKSN